MYLISRCRYVLRPRLRRVNSVNLSINAEPCWTPVTVKGNGSRSLTGSGIWPVSRKVLVAFITEHEQRVRHMRSLVQHMALTTFRPGLPLSIRPRFGDGRLQVDLRGKLIWPASEVPAVDWAILTILTAVAMRC